MILGFTLSELRTEKGVVGEHACPDGCVAAVCVCMCVFMRHACMYAHGHVLYAHVYSEKIRAEVWRAPAGDHSQAAMETKVVLVCLTRAKESIISLLCCTCNMGRLC